MLMSVNSTWKGSYDKARSYRSLERPAILRGSEARMEASDNVNRSLWKGSHVTRNRLLTTDTFFIHSLSAIHSTLNRNIYTVGLMLLN